MTNTKSRLTFIDGVRGIAALCVLASHLIEEVVPNSHYFSRNFFTFGEMGVAAFFLVSGFVIPLSLERSRSVTAFAIGRFFRIYPLYIFALIASVALAWKGFQPFQEHLGSNQPRFWLTHLLMIQEYAGEGGKNIVEGSWTLILEIVWYVGMAILFVMGLNRKTRFLAIATALGVAALAMASWWLDRRLPMGRLCLLQACVVGMICFRSYQNEISNRETILWVALNMASTGLALWVSFGHFQHKEYALSAVAPSWLAGYLLFLGLFVMRKLQFVNSWFLDYIGEISYSVYLLHPLVIFALLPFLGQNWMTILLTVLITLPLSHFSYQWIETPGIQFGKQLVKKLHPAPSNRTAETNV